MRSCDRRLTALVVAALLLAAATRPSAAQPTAAEDLYSEAQSRETALRAELATAGTADTSPLVRRVRTLVGAYQDLARIFPTSEIADDALWQGAALSDDVFRTFGDALDRDTAVRLLQRLAARFPTSPFAPQTRTRIARLSAAPATTASRAASASAASTVAPATAGRRAPARAAADDAPAGVAPRPAAAAAAPVSASAPPAPPPTAAAAARSAEPAARSTTPPPAATAPPTAPYLSTDAGSDAAPRTAALAPQTLLTAIRREELPDAVRIVLELERETPFVAERLDGPPRVFVDLSGTRASNMLSNIVLPYADGAVRQVRVGRQAGRTRVVLDLRSGTGRHSVYVLYDPYRVVVDFERPVTTAAPARPVPETQQVAHAQRPLPLPARSIALAERARTPPAPTQSWPSDVPSTASVVAGSRLPGPADVALASAPPAGIPQVPRIPATPAANVSGGFSLARQLGLGISRIVIDPGHGGHDPGAKVRGLSEADLVLDVALRLERLLHRSGIDVVLTRRTDAFVSLDQRTAIANRAEADLFISVHANASRSARTNGVESYFLNFAPNAAAKAVAARENASSARQMRHLPELLRVLATNNKIAESRDLAAALQTSLFRELRRANPQLRDLGVKQAPFMVLIGATMPSALTEVAFITNREDAARLRTETYKQRLAEGLHAGILRYQQSIKRAPAIATR